MGKISFIRTDNGGSGGNAYENMLFEHLTGRHDAEIVYATSKKKNILLNRTELLLKLIGLKGKSDIWVRRHISTVTLPFDGTMGKNILIFHHLDNSTKKYPLLNGLLDMLFYRGLGRIDAIVTVSEYWRQHFISRGYQNVHLIYNAFDLGDFEFKKAEVESFKRVHGLFDKPIIYIGNCQASKGVLESYYLLRDLDVHLVTSGKQNLDIPSINLELNRRDYLLLLKSASIVVTMSKFREGWCRTAHEAMLCGTPVIGSGLGGMGELLDGGGQLICRDFENLKPLVMEMLRDREKSRDIGGKGYAYAKKFTKDKFAHEWDKLIGSLQALP